jgi:hypothetical protein
MFLESLKASLNSSAPRKERDGASFNLMAQASSGSSRSNNADTHRQLLDEMKKAADDLGFSLGQVLSNLGRQFNPDAPMHPRDALAALMHAYEEGVNRYAAGDPAVPLSRLTEMSNAVNELLLANQNSSAAQGAQRYQFSADVASFVRSSSVGMAGGLAMKIGGPPAGAFVGGMTSLATINAMALSATAQGLPLEQLNIPRTLVGDVGNLLTTIGSPHLLAFFNLPGAPTANTMRGIVMHMVRQGGADAAIDSLFVAFSEAAFFKQPIPDALRAGAVQGVFSFLTTAGISGIVSGMDAAKSRNFAQMITALDDNDVNRLMSQFSPEQAQALREASPTVYRALNGRTDGAMDTMLNNQRTGGPAARGEVELVEIRPGEFVRSDAIETQSRQPNPQTVALNRRPTMGTENVSTRSNPAGAVTPPTAAASGGTSSTGATATVSLGGDELVVSRRGDDLIVTVPGGQYYTLPEGMKIEEAERYLQGLYLRGSLPGYEAPRHGVTLGDQDFAILGERGVFGIETPRREIKTFEPSAATRNEAEQRLRDAWRQGTIDGFGPPRTPLALGNTQLSVIGEPGGPFFVQREPGASLMRIDARTADEAVHKAGQAWLAGRIAGLAPPVSRLTLDAEGLQVVTILGGGRGPFALGDRDGRYITDLTSRGSNAVTSLAEASDMAKEAWGQGLLSSFGIPGPARTNSAPASSAGHSPSSSTLSVSEPSAASTTGPEAAPARTSGAVSGLATANAQALDPTDIRSVLRLTQDGWSDELANLPHQTREQMIATLRKELAQTDDWESAPLERAVRVLTANRTHPDPKDVLAVVAFVERNWSDQLADAVPPAVLDEMTSTLWHAARSTDPNLQWDRDRIVRAMSTLHEAGGQAFPNPGDITHGSGFAREMESAEFGVRDGDYRGVDTRGNPVFETRDGRRVGPFYDTAMQLAAEAAPDEPKTPLSTFKKIRQYVDVRAGAGISLTDPITGDPAARAALVVGLDTPATIVDDLRRSAAARRSNASAEAAASLEGVDGGLSAPEGVSEKPEIADESIRWFSDTLPRAFGVSVRTQENIQDPRIVSRLALNLIGLRGFGTNSALQFKVSSLNNAAIDNLRGGPSGFVFNLAQRDAVTLDADRVYITGNLTLDAKRVPTQMDIFGNDQGVKYELNQDLPIDKTLKELYLPRLDFPIGSTPSGEYRAESNGGFVIPAGSIVPEQFVRIVNGRVSSAEIEVSVPNPFSVSEEGVAAARGEIERALSGGASFLDDLTKEDFSAEMVSGGAARVSSVPGKPLEGPNNLDINFRSEENVSEVVRLAQRLLGKEPTNLSFERAISGTLDPVGAMRGSENHLNDKLRFKLNLPFSADFGLVKIRTAAYVLREAQPDMRTHLMTSTEPARLGFSDEFGRPRELDVPTWLATMVSASKAPGFIEAELGMARFPAGGIVVPPGGKDSLRGYMADRFQNGTPGQREAITTFLDMYMSDGNRHIEDGKTLMPDVRDELGQVLYMLAEPVEHAPWE